jgi:hypothetical protein
MMGKLYYFHGWICGPRIYEYNGWIFELSASSGPWPLNKDLSPRKRAGNKFYDVFDNFDRLSDKDKESFRVGGGCQIF